MTPFFCMECGTQFSETAPACPSCGYPAEASKQLIASTEPLATPDGGPVAWNYSGELRGKCPKCQCDGTFPEVGGRDLVGYFAKQFRANPGGFKVSLLSDLANTVTGLLGGAKVGLYRKCEQCKQTFFVCRTCMRPNKEEFVVAVVARGETCLCRLCGKQIC